MVNNILILITILTLSAGCKQSVDMNSQNVSRISGELFLQGPDEDSVKIRIDDPSTIGQLLKELQGRRIADRKEQGVAILEIHYQKSRSKKVQLAENNIARVDGKPIEVNTEMIIELLKKGSGNADGDNQQLTR